MNLAQECLSLFQDLRDLFERYDVNRNGHISVCELRNLITSENYAQDLPEVAVQRILKRADIDQNGHLDYAEFKDMVDSIIEPTSSPFFGLTSI
jgi:Ca2+-binding EF-hand superfamily protein